MNNFNTMFRFTTKRNGIDDLEKLLIVIYLILFITSIFIKNFYLDLGCIVLVAIIIFRFLSKNIVSREKENNIYLKIKNKLLFKQTKKDDYIYKKCHKCHTILRLPIPTKRGIKHVKCPKCSKKNTLLILKKIKVEVIRKDEV